MWLLLAGVLIVAWAVAYLATRATLWAWDRRPRTRPDPDPGPADPFKRTGGWDGTAGR